MNKIFNSAVHEQFKSAGEEHIIETIGNLIEETSLRNDKLRSSIKSICLFIYEP